MLVIKNLSSVMKHETKSILDNEKIDEYFSGNIIQKEIKKINECSKKQVRFLINLFELKI